MADGESLSLYAPFVDALIAQKKIAPVLLIGIHSGKRLPGTDPRKSDVRALEYLYDFGETNQKFEAHENFVLQELLPWAEAMFNAPNQRR